MEPSAEKESKKDNLEKSEVLVTKMLADRNADLITRQVSQLNSTDGNFSQNGLWKLKSKILPHPSDPPMAKKDDGCNLITSPLPLKKLYLETYRKRLAPRPMKEEYKDIFQLKTLLWKLRLEYLKIKKSAPWNLDNQNGVITKLKNFQSIDP